MHSKRSKNEVLLFKKVATYALSILALFSGVSFAHAAISDSTRLVGGMRPFTTLVESIRSGTFSYTNVGHTALQISSALPEELIAMRSTFARSAVQSIPTDLASNVNLAFPPLVFALPSTEPLLALISEILDIVELPSLARDARIALLGSEDREIGVAGTNLELAFGVKPTDLVPRIFTPGTFSSEEALETGNSLETGNWKLETSTGFLSTLSSKLLADFTVPRLAQSDLLPLYVVASHETRDSRNTNSASLFAINHQPSTVTGPTVLGASTTALAQKKTLPFFDRVSLSLYCALAKNNVDGSRCNYDAVRSGQYTVNSDTQPSTTLPTSNPQLLTGSSPSDALAVLNSKLSAGSTPVYITKYVTEYVAVPGAPGRDGRDGKNGNDGVTAVNNIQAPVGMGSYIIPYVSSPSATIGISTIGYLKDTTIDAPIINRGTATNLSLLYPTISNGVFNGLSVFNNSVDMTGATLISNLTATSSQLLDANVTNLFVTAATSTDSYITRLVAASSTLTDAMLTNSTTTNAYISNLVAASSTLVDLIATNASTTNSTTTLAYITNLFADNATTTNLYVTSLSVGSSTSATLTITGDLTVQGTTTLATTTVTDFVASRATSTSLYSSLLTAITGLFTDLTATNATTTNLFVQNLAVGNASTTGNQSIDGTFTVTGTSTMQSNTSLNGSVTIGTSTSNMLTVNALVNSDFSPAQNKVYDLGSPSFYWRTLYADNINVNSISAASTTISGTANNSFGINSDNGTNDSEDATLVFFRGLVTPNALIRWNGTTKRLEANQSFLVMNETPSIGTTTFTIQGGQGQGTTNLFELKTNAGTTTSVFDVNGWLGIGTTTPVGKVHIDQTGSSYGLTIDNNVQPRIDLNTSQSGSSNWNIINEGNANKFSIRQTGGAAQFFIESGAPVGSLGIKSTGNVGVGTSTPTSLLTVASSTASGTSGLFSVGTTASLFNVLANGNVGIGTSTPQAILHLVPTGAGQAFIDRYTTDAFANEWVTRKARGTAGAPVVVNQNDELGGLEAYGYDGATFIAGSAVRSLVDGTVSSNTLPTRLSFFVNKGAAAVSEVFTIKSSGNVGISTTTPTSLLSVASSTATGTSRLFGVGTSTDIMTVLANGNVGIGTSTPDSTLQVYGGITVGTNTNSATSTGINFRGSGWSGQIYPFVTNTIAVTSRWLTSPGTVGAPGLANTSDTASGIYYPAVSNVGLVTAGVERVRIDGSGNVGIGTSTPGSRLQITGGDIAIETNRYLFVPGNGVLNIGDSSDVINISNGSVYVNPNGGNVGIGTTTPDSKLQIYSSSSVGAALTIESDIDTGTDSLGAILNLSRFNSGPDAMINFQTDRVDKFSIGLDGDGTYNLRIQNGGNNVVTVEDAAPANSLIVKSTTGNIGIGTSTPISLFHVSGTTAATATLETTTANRTPSFTFRTNTTGNNVDLGTIDFYNAASGVNATISQIAGFQGTSGTEGALRFLTRSGSGLTEAVRINNSGYTGFGTTSPLYRIDAYNSDGAKIARFKDTDSTYAGILISGDTNGGYVGNTDVGTGIGESIYFQNSSNTMRFYTLGTEKMRIANTGNVGIGTTTPTSLLSVASSTATGTSRLFGVGTSTDIMTVLANGNVGIGTSSPNYNFTSIGTSYFGVTSGLRITTNGTVADISGMNTSGANNDIGIRTGGSYNLYINTAGNVGIGTTSPIAKLTTYTTQSTGASIAHGIRVAESTGDYGVNIGAGTNYGWIQGIQGGQSTVGANSLALNPQGGNVGIGTTTPGYTTVISGSDATLSIDNNGGSASFIRMNNGGTARFVLDARSTATSFNSITAPITFITASTERMRIDNAGNVGIGTTTPANKLSVMGTIAAGSHAVDGQWLIRNPNMGAADRQVALGVASYNTLPEGNGVYAPILQGRSNNSGDFAYYFGYNGIYSSSTPVSGNQDALVNATSSALLLGFNRTNNATYFTAGNVGIGTTTPATLLQVGSQTGGLNFASAISSIPDLSALGNAFIGVTGTGGSAPFDNVGNLVLAARQTNNDSRSNILFYTSSPSTEKMRITNSGNVGIGTTTPTQKLDINGPFTSWGGWVLSGAPGGPVGAGAANSAATRYIGAGGTSNNFYFNVPIGGGYSFGIGESAKVRFESNGNVGIGTTTPAYKFAVVGDAYIGGNITATGTLSAGAVSFTTLSTTGTTTLATAGGNIGIGTSTPGSILDVQGVSPVFNLKSTSGEAWMVNDSPVKGGLMFKRSGTQKWVTYNNNTDDSYNVGLSTSDNKFTITSAGNVGIGTSSPASLFHVYGSGLPQIRVDGPTESRIGFAVNNTLKMIAGHDSTSGYFGTVSGGGDLSLQTSGTNKVTITSSGNVGIGSSTPGYKLSVVGDAYFGGNVTATGTLTVATTTISGQILAAAGLVSAPAYSFSSDTNTGMYQVTSDRLGFAIGGLNAFDIRAAGLDVQNVAVVHLNAGTTIGTSAGYISATPPTSGLLVEGNVGIGTTTPAERIHAFGNNVGLRLEETSGYYALINTDSSGTVNLRANSANAGSAGGTIRMFSGSTETVRISSTGNVGIGTTSPTAKLDVWGNLNVGTSSTPTLFANTATGNVAIGGPSSNQKLSVFGGNILIENITSNNITPNRWIGLGATNGTAFDAASGMLINSATGVLINIDSNNDDTDTRNFTIAKNNDRFSSTNTAAGTALFTVLESGNVGIGTSTPDTYGLGYTRQVTVSTGGANTSSAALSIVGGTTGSGIIDFGNETIRRAAITGLNGSDLSFSTNNTNSGITLSERMRITSAGNVGIGTSTPAYALNIATANTATPGVVVTGGTGGQSTLASHSLTIGSSIGGTNGGGLSASAGNITLSSASADVIFSPAVTERMRITSTGNVGIGTTTPGSLLTVGGTINATGTISSNTYLQSGGTGSGIDGRLYAITGAGVNAAVIQANGTSYFNGGNVGIGTTTPRTALEIQSSTADMLTLSRTSGLAATIGVGGYVNAGDIGLTPSVSNSGVLLRSRNTTGSLIDAFYVAPAGNVGIGTSTPTSLLSVASSTATGTSRLFGVGTSTDIMTVLANGNVALSSGSKIIDATNPAKYILLENGSGYTTLQQYTGYDFTAYDGVAYTSQFKTTALLNQSSGVYTTAALTPTIRQTGTAGYVALKINVTEASTGSGSNLIQDWQVGGVSKMVVTNTGNVGIGTTSPVAKLDVWGNVNVGTSSTPALFADSSLTRVGVGTNAPTERFHVSGNTRLGGSVFIDTTNYLATDFIQQRASGLNLTLRTESGSNRSIILSPDGTGNVGIGTTSPTFRVDTYNTDGTKLARFKDTDSTYSGVIISGDTNGGYIGNTDLGVGTGESIYFQNSINALRLFTSGVERMRLSANGNLSLGTTTTNSFVSISSSTAATSNSLFGVGRTDLSLFNILGSGNVGIGTSTPQGKFEIEGGVDSAPATSTLSSDFIMRYSPTGTNLALDFGGYTGGGSPYNWIQSRSAYAYNSTYNLALNPNGGNVGIGTTSPSALLTLGGSQAGITVDRAGNDSYVQFSSGGVSAGQVRYIAPDVLGFADANGNDKVAFNTSSGSVGIGTTSPRTLLDLTSSNPIMTFTDTDGGYNQISGNGAFTLMADSGNTQSGSRFAFEIDATEVMRINAGGGLAIGSTYVSTNPGAGNMIMSGNLGIGTTTPSYLLTLAQGTTTAQGISFGGDTNLYRSGAGALRLGSLALDGTAGVVYGLGLSNISTGNNAYVGVSATGPTITRNIADANPALVVRNIHATSTGDILQLRGSANTSLFTVTNSGNVGIGTTTPQADFIVEGTTPVDIAIRDNSQSANIKTYALRNQSGNLTIGRVNDAYSTLTPYMTVQNGGNIGIGTTTPSAKFVVSGNTLFTQESNTDTYVDIDNSTSFNREQQIRFFEVGTARGYIGLKGATNGLYINSGNSQPLIINADSSSGNIGIGTTTPNGTLTVAGAGFASIVAGLRTEIATTSILLSLDAGATKATSFQNINGALTLYTGGTIGSVVGTARMTVDASGNVGIGTTTPGSKLVVYNDANNYADIMSSSGYSAFVRSIAAGATLSVVARDVAGYGLSVQTAGTSSSDYALNVTSNGGSTTGLRVTNSGNIGIGTTTPLTTLHTASTTPILTIEDTNSSSANSVGYIDLRSTQGSYGKFGRIANGVSSELFTIADGSNTNFFNLNTSGFIGIGTTTPADKLNLASGNFRLTGMSANQGIYADNAAGVGLFSLTRQNTVATGDLSISAFGGVGITGGNSAYGSGVASGYSLYVTSTGNVGIGTTTPGQKLTVAGHVQITGSGNGLYFPDGTFIGTAAGTSTGITSPTDVALAADNDTDGSGVLTFSTNGSERMRVYNNGTIGVGTTSATALFAIASSTASGTSGLFSVGTTTDTIFNVLANGNVGIGTTSPSALFTVGSNNNFTVASDGQATANGVVSPTFRINSRILLNASDTTRLVVSNLAASTGISFGFDTDGTLKLRNRGDTADATLTAGTSTFSGSVGIGTTTPSQKLDIASSDDSMLRLSKVGGGWNYINFYNASTGIRQGYFGMGSTGTDMQFSPSSGHVTIPGGDLAIGFANGSTSPAGGLIVANNVGIGTSTPGSKLDVWGNLNVGTSSTPALFVDSSLSRVGVNTNSPSVQFEVSSDVNNSTKGIMVGQHSTDVGAAVISFQKSRGTRASPLNVANGDYSGAFVAQNYQGGAYRTNGSFGFRVNGTVGSNDVPGQWYWAASNASDVDPYLNGSVRMVVNSTGEVGIGSTTPGYKLTVVGDGYFGGNLIATGTVSSSSGYDISSTTLTSLLSVSATTVLGRPGATNVLSFGQASNGYWQTLGFYTGNGSASSEKMRITTTGNVGIGTTTPTSLLSVASSTATGTSRLFGVGTSTDIMTVLANGNVGIGTSTPQKKLHVYGDNGTDFLFQVESPNREANFLLLAASSTAQGASFSFRQGSAAGDGWNIANNASSNLVFTSRVSGVNTDRITVLPTGNVGVGTTSPTAKLDVWGNLNVGTSSTPTLFVNTALTRVGIGTTSPSAALTVQQLPGGSTGLFNVLASTNSSWFSVGATGAGNVEFNIAGGQTLVGTAVVSQGARLNLTSGSSGSKGMSIYGVSGQTSNLFEVSSSTGGNGDFFVLGATGNVGIGTTTPGSKLDLWNNTASSDVNIFRIGTDVGSTNNVVFRIDSDGDLFTDGAATFGTPADIAESYSAVEAVDAGTVVAFATSTNLWSSTKGSDTASASSSDVYEITGVRKAHTGGEAVGIVSTRPGLHLGADIVNGVPVALSGRVPVKVTTENGEVVAGDYLTVSLTRPGYAMKLTGEGRAIGRAISSYVNGNDKVMAFIENGYQKVDMNGKSATTTGMLTTGNVDLNANGVAIYNVKSLASANGTWSIDENGRITAKVLCLEDVCIDKTQLTNILNSTGQTGTVSGSQSPVSSGTSTDPSGNQELGTGNSGTGEVAGTSTEAGAGTGTDNSQQTIDSSNAGTGETQQTGDSSNTGTGDSGNTTPTEPAPTDPTPVATEPVTPPVSQGDGGEVPVI